MVVHVAVPQQLAQPRPRPPMMDMKMQHVIAHIADDEAGQNREDEILPKRQPQHAIRCGHDGHAHQGRHHQTERIVGVFVMNSVNQEVHASSDRRSRMRVKQEAVAEIFHQRPDKISGETECDRLCNRQGAERKIQQRRRDRRVDDQRNEVMHTRHLVEQPAPEETGGGRQVISTGTAQRAFAHDCSAPASFRRVAPFPGRPALSRHVNIEKGGRDQFGTGAPGLSPVYKVAARRSQAPARRIVPIRFGAGFEINAMKAVVLAALMLALSGSAACADDIGGTGHIEPKGGIVLLNGVPGARVLSISVRAGQMVRRGDLLMTLDDREERASEQIAELALSQAGKDAAQNLAAELTAVRIDEEHRQRAMSDANAYRSLGPDATSQKQLADYNQAAEEAQLQLGVERKKERQVRADNAVSIASAARRLDIERQKLALYRVTAPSDGMILRIDQHVGESLNGGPAIEMGDIRTMYVICQAFQGDLLKLRPGMRATIKNSAFAKSLTGTVENVGRLVDTKAQLGDVKIRLDDPAVASRVVGMEVEVQIARQH